MENAFLSSQTNKAQRVNRFPRILPLWRSCAKSLTRHTCRQVSEKPRNRSFSSKTLFQNNVTGITHRYVKSTRLPKHIVSSRRCCYRVANKLYSLPVPITSGVLLSKGEAVFNPIRAKETHTGTLPALSTCVLLSYLFLTVFSTKQPSTTTTVLPRLPNLLQTVVLFLGREIHLLSHNSARPQHTMPCHAWVCQCVCVCTWGMFANDKQQSSSNRFFSLFPPRQSRTLWKKKPSPFPLQM